MTATAPTRALDTVVERAAAYTLLAHCFAYPDGSAVDGLHEAASEARDLVRDVALLRLATVAAEVSREALEPAFVALSTFSTSPDSPLFETAYFPGEAQQQTQRMADVAGFYRAFGVDSAESGLRPDDLPVELEFMAYLCRKEAYAMEHLGAPRVAQVRRAQRLFLEEHLGRWAPAAGRKLVVNEAASPFYRMCGEALSAWVLKECAATGAHPDPVSGEVSKDWREPVSHGPEFAGNADFVPLEEVEVR